MVDGKALGFEVLGLKDGVFLMSDRETDSVWTHFEGKALEGRLAGTQMPLIPLQQMEWGEWKERRPDTLVLAENTGFENRYREVRPGFATGFTGAFVDERLPPNAIVIGVRAGDQDRAYPVDLITARSGMVNDELAGMPIVVTYDAAAAWPTQEPSTAKSSPSSHRGRPQGRCATSRPDRSGTRRAPRSTAR